MDNLNQQKQNAACIELCGPSRDSSVAPKKKASFLKRGKSPIFGVFRQARWVCSAFRLATQLLLSGGALKKENDNDSDNQNTGGV